MKNDPSGESRDTDRKLIIPDDLGMHYYKGFLCEEEKAIYDLIERSAEELRQETPVPCRADRTGIFTAYKAYFYDHREKYYLGTRITVRNKMIYFPFLYSREQTTEIDPHVKRMIMSFADDSHCPESVMDRARSVYSRVTKECSYSDSGKTWEHNLAGIGLFRKGVCEGIGSSLAVCLRKAGIPSAEVTGTMGGRNHTWTKAWIGNEEYHLDPTLDLGKTSFSFFCLSEDEISCGRLVFSPSETLRFSG